MLSHAAYSSDLNPIEKMWPKVKANLSRDHDIQLALPPLSSSASSRISFASARTCIKSRWLH